MIDNEHSLPRTQGRFSTIATLASFVSLLSYAIVFTIVPASINQISIEFSASPASLAWFLRAIMAGFFLSVIAATRYADKHGNLRPLLFGCLAMAVGLITFAQAHNFYIALAALFIAGLGGGATEGSSTALLSELYHGSGRTAMLNWSQALFGLGAILSPLTVAELLKLNLSWRIAFVGGGLLASFSLILAFVTLVSGKEFTQSRERSEPVQWITILRDPVILPLGIAMMLYVGAEGGPASWLALFFKRDLTPDSALAASSLAFFWTGILLGRIAAAYVVRFISDVTLIRSALFFSAVFQALLLITHSVFFALAVSFLLGFSLSPIWPTIAAITAASHPRQSASILGVVIAFGSLGALIFPPLTGWFANIVGIRSALWISFILLAINLWIFSANRRVKLQN